jgi:hypothetical protein
MRMLAGRTDTMDGTIGPGRTFARYGTGDSKGEHNMSANQSKQFADKSAKMVCEDLEEGIAAAERSARGLNKAMPPQPKASATLMSGSLRWPTLMRRRL